MEFNLKIAIIKLSSLGDVIHTSICLQFIKKHFANAEICWFVDEKFAEILSFSSTHLQVVALPIKNKKIKKSWQILQNFKNKFDVIIDLQGLLKSAIVARILGKEIFGFDKSSSKEGISSIFYKHKYNCDYAKNIILRNLELCAFALNFTFNKQEILEKSPCFTALDYEFNINFSKKQKILLAPFASNASKCYIHYDKLIKELENFAEIFVIAGNSKERQMAEILVKNTKATLLEPLNLGQILAFFNKCDLLIGNDSGISHLAWAQNLASITLFGNTNSNRNSFQTAKNLSIQSSKKIQQINSNHIDKSDFCINDIKVQDILTLAKKLLGVKNER